MERPNLLIFFTDQQRADTISSLGNPDICTPNLDRLVREGTAFTRAYSASPVCVSSRCALATGQMAARTGCWDNMAMPQDVPSYMEVLAGAGYQTHGVGKMHFTPDPRRMWGYQSRDFSEEGVNGDFNAFLKENGYGHVLAPHGLRGEYYYTPQPSQLPAELHETRWVADRAKEFLENRDRTKPFLLDCHFIKPHPPFENPMPWSYLYRTADMAQPHLPDDYRDFWSRVNVLQNRYKYKERGIADDLAWRTMKAAYYASISFIDQQVGRVLDSLGDELENTLVIFSSDHGEMLGDYGCVGKRCMLEASARVPLIARYPESFEAGARVRRAVSLLDVFPTLLEASGIDGAASGLTLDGESLQSAVLNREERRVVISQFQSDWMGHYMATDGTNKVVYSAADNKEWHFSIGDDLKERPETANGDFAALRSDLIRRLEAFPATVAVEEGDWRRHEAFPWPDDPDYGLLKQDPPGLKEMMESIASYGNYRGEDVSVACRSLIEHTPHRDITN